MTTTVGDRIIVERADGRCDLFIVDRIGMRVRLRANLANRGTALEAVQASLRCGVRVWVGTDDAPEVLEPWPG